MAAAIKYKYRSLESFELPYVTTWKFYAKNGQLCDINYVIYVSLSKNVTSSLVIHIYTSTWLLIFRSNFHEILLSNIELLGHTHP